MHFSHKTIVWVPINSPSLFWYIFWFQLRKLLPKVLNTISASVAGSQQFSVFLGFERQNVCYLRWKKEPISIRNNFLQNVVFSERSYRVTLSELQKIIKWKQICRILLLDNSLKFKYTFPSEIIAMLKAFIQILPLKTTVFIKFDILKAKQFSGPNKYKGLCQDYRICMCRSVF